MPNHSNFAILAPVPLEHLESGLQIAAQKEFVAFGTRKWEVLRKADEWRGDAVVPMLIYPSHEDTVAKDNFVVGWYGWYIGHVDSPNGRHPAGMEYRPASTAKYPKDNLGYWAAFWHVRALRKLPKERCLTIGKIGTVKGGWRKDSPPRGPELVEIPQELSDET